MTLGLCWASCPHLPTWNGSLERIAFWLGFPSEAQCQSIPKRMLGSSSEPAFLQISQKGVRTGSAKYIQSCPFAMIGICMSFLKGLFWRCAPKKNEDALEKTTNDVRHSQLSTTRRGIGVHTANCRECCRPLTRCVVRGLAFGLLSGIFKRPPRSAAPGPCTLTGARSKQDMPADRNVCECECHVGQRQTPPVLTPPVLWELW